LTVFGASSIGATSSRFPSDAELEAELNQWLTVLASNDVTDPEELRGQALASFPLA